MELETVRFAFVEEASGRVIEVETEIGRSILDVAKEFDIDLEGACEGSLACSTCHVKLEQDVYDSLEEPEEEEEDMLDLAFNLGPTSRLGCQVIISEKLEGTKVIVPSATRNIK